METEHEFMQNIYIAVAVTVHYLIQYSTAITAKQAYQNRCKATIFHTLGDFLSIMPDYLRD
ncbi:Uncharacterised protein [BD1-7 clade bacterium]|uniref:Uncharacterized protein n=1 Tax=BD1-7 clade bacterium TaxID=2029982 RepID=A0A5S9Q4T1_9GAMM|nr:Uncharacterised protein [BD1-7 clade bacterium]CAA0111980.1 Uncharacterised protein [BD1-7 clade bacterium]